MTNTGSHFYCGNFIPSDKDKPKVFLGRFVAKPIDAYGTGFIRALTLGCRESGRVEVWGVSSYDAG